MVDQRTMEKYEREAKEQNRESWYLLSWALDTNKEECAKLFKCSSSLCTILDTPDHKNFVSSMIGGASQAVLATTSGVNRLIIAISKMDEATVNWSKESGPSLLEYANIRQKNQYNISDSYHGKYKTYYEGFMEDSKELVIMRKGSLHFTIDKVRCLDLWEITCKEIRNSFKLKFPKKFQLSC
nr:6592_t:CDS:2 [Entrophospora candida]